MFVEKLNKKGRSIRTRRGENTTGGKWEGYLDHDNAM